MWLNEWKRAATLFHDPEDLAIAEEVARVYSQSDLKFAQTRQIELKKQLAKCRYVDPADIAYTYAGLGDIEQAFIWLEKRWLKNPEG